MRSRRPAVPYLLVARLLLFWGTFATLLATSGAVVAFFRKPWATSAALGALVSLSMGVLMLLYSRKGWTDLPACGIGFDRQTPLRLGVGILLGCVLVSVPALVLANFDGVRWVRGPALDFTTVGGTALSYLLLACMEEVGFRSYPLLGLHRQLGLWTAQGIVAAAFIVYHLVGGQDWVGAAIGAGLGSLLFGMAAVASRGLALPIGLHAAWNFGAWALGDKGGPGLWTPVFAQPPGASGSFAYVAAFLVWTVGFLWWRQRPSRTTPYLTR